MSLAAHHPALCKRHATRIGSHAFYFTISSFTYPKHFLIHSLKALELSGKGLDIGSHSAFIGNKGIIQLISLALCGENHKSANRPPVSLSERMQGIELRRQPCQNTRRMLSVFKSFGNAQPHLPENPQLLRLNELCIAKSTFPFGNIDITRLSSHWIKIAENPTVNQLQIGVIQLAARRVRQQFSYSKRHNLRLKPSHLLWVTDAEPVLKNLIPPGKITLKCAHLHLYPANRLLTNSDADFSPTAIAMQARLVFASTENPSALMLAQT